MYTSQAAVGELVANFAAVSLLPFLPHLLVRIVDFMNGDGRGSGSLACILHYHLHHGHCYCLRHHTASVSTIAAARLVAGMRENF